MRKMKKRVCLALAVGMIAAMSVTASAEDNKTVSTDSGTATIPVKGTCLAGGSTISVTIAWEGMEFTYRNGTVGNWDATEHKYENDAGAGWSADKGKITITNHSADGVTAGFSWKQNENIAGTITGVFSVDGTALQSSETELESANQAKYQQQSEDGTYPAPTKTVEFGITGGAIDKDYENLGTITVTIRKTAVGDEGDT